MDEPEPTVAQYMSTPVVIVRDHDSLWHAMDRFTVSALHHLVVLDQQDDFVGVLEDRQLFPACLPWGTSDVHARSVGEVLRRQGRISSRDQRVSVMASVQTAAAVMVRQHVDALAVVNDRGHVLGVVTMSDIVRALIGARLELPEKSGGTSADAT